MGARVVIAEDEALIRLDLRETLEEEGYEVVAETGRGDEVVALVREHRPDLAILDIKMPGMDGLTAAAALRVIAPGGWFELPPFSLQFIRMSHSIPEAQALVIRTPAGTVLHTGDWKLDPDPLIGPRTDEAALAKLGEEGVLAMICNSTNAMVEGHSGSEAEVRRSLAALVRSTAGAASP